MLVADDICRDAVCGEGDRMLAANEAATSYVFHASMDYPMLVAGDFLHAIWSTNILLPNGGAPLAAPHPLATPCRSRSRPAAPTPTLAPHLLRPAPPHAPLRAPVLRRHHPSGPLHGEDGEVDGDEENGYMQNQMEEEDTEGETDDDDSDESDDGEEVPIPGRWNQNFSSAMTINDGLDSNWEYHQNNLAVGAMFPSKRHMQDAIIKWAMASQRELRTTVSSGKYLTMECVDINCPGRVHGYVPKYDTTWCVSDFVPHSCELASIRNDHCNLSSNLIARLLYTEIVEGQAMRVNAIQKNVKKHHFYTISYGKAWRAKQRAMKMRFGSFRDAYDTVVRLL
ncbi:hypothetical protein QYE76_059907 [Lolium multiflorum]|uniref:Transposase MuDR plant domain-containing protein n=1 Tax=Lolium multiflorum TaxID=4521 RepID=A0AAD8S167_LOLMU|nr:hypothetical protein QYE76_059907 [Lolium multiflorum]